MGQIDLSKVLGEFAKIGRIEKMIRTRRLTRRRENRGFRKSLVVHAIIRRRWSAFR